jgi:hypothetical protein
MSGFLSLDFDSCSIARMRISLLARASFIVGSITLAGCGGGSADSAPAKGPDPAAEVAHAPCPANTDWDGARCVAHDCAGGMHWNGYACFPVPSAGGVPVTIHYEESLKAFFVATGVTATLDGVKVLEKSSGLALAKGATIPVFGEPLAPGDHTLAITWLFRSPKGRFAMNVQAQHAFSAVADRPLRVDVKLAPHDGAKFEDRVAASFIEDVGKEHAEFMGRTLVVVTTDESAPKESLP